MCQSALKFLLPVLRGVYLGVEPLGHVVILGLIWRELPLFLHGAHHILCSPQQCTRFWSLRNPSALARFLF